MLFLQGGGGNVIFVNKMRCKVRNEIKSKVLRFCLDICIK